MSGRVLRMLAGPTLLLAATTAAALTETQQRARIDLEVTQFEELIGNSGDLQGDAALDAYLQQVLDKLFPEQPVKLRVRAIRDSEFNAFALPSGGIYFNTGALLRIKDEAQLASVLGHEGTHVTGDHTFKQTVRNKHVAATMTAGIFLSPLLAAVAGVSSMAGFSREHEREADRGGFERLVSSGYEPKAGAELFGQMDRELAIRKLPQGMYFYASHPRIKERVTSLTELAAGKPAGGERNREHYLEVASGARLAALAQIHKRGDGKLLVFLLDAEQLLETLPPDARYYLGEGYRLRGEAGDAQRATEQYELTVQQAPTASPAYQALGLQHLRAGRKPEALAMFERYLELAPTAPQAAYARQYVQQIRQEMTP